METKGPPFTSREKEEGNKRENGLVKHWVKC
jgi:hypothetical protein